MGILIITHHDKLLERNTPDFTHVMLGGRIVETGGVELAHELTTNGYDRIRAAYPEAAQLNQGDARRRRGRGLTNQDQFTTEITETTESNRRAQGRWRQPPPCSLCSLW